MTEITLFTRMRPTEQPLAASEREALRHELFGDESQFDAALTRVVAVGTFRRRRRSVSLVAAAVAVFGLLGIWVVAREQPSPTEAPPTEAPPTSNVLSSGTEYPVPRVAVDQPGWVLTSAVDSVLGRTGAVVFGSALQFDGPWVQFEIVGTDGYVGVTSGTVPVAGEESIAVGSVAGTTFSIRDETIVVWTDGAGNHLWAAGWKLSAQQIAELAANVTVEGADLVVAAPLPAGYEVATPAAASALNRYASYSFTHDDGRVIEIQFLPSARGIGTLSPDPYSVSVSIAGESMLLYDYGGGAYRSTTQRGFWGWIFQGEGFTEGDFVSLVASIRVVDQASWEASLPDNIVGDNDRTAAVAALLTDVPLPPGFDVVTLASRKSTADRYQFIAEVSGAVACAWFDQWFDGADANDAALQAEAAAALATSHDWAMLIEIDDQGGWSSAFWEYADAVNGGPGVATGEGVGLPTRPGLESGMNCHFD